MCVLRALRQTCGGFTSTPPGRVVQCARGEYCAVFVCRRRSQSTTTFYADLLSLQQHKQPTQHSRQNAASVVGQARGGVIDVASAYRNPPPHDFASLRRGLPLIWPRHTGQAFAEILALCGTGHLLRKPASFSLLLHAAHLVDHRRNLGMLSICRQVSPADAG